MNAPVTQPNIKEPDHGATPDREPKPESEPKGPRTPYPVDEPVDPRGPGSEPYYFPGKPGGGELPKTETENAGRSVLLTVSDCVCAALGCASAMR